METPIQVVDSTTPNLDGPVWLAASSCALTDVHVYLFVGAGELGFFPRHFFIGINNDPTCILLISSTIVTDLIGESLSLKIFIVSRLLFILKQFSTVVMYPLIHSIALAMHLGDL